MRSGPNFAGTFFMVNQFLIHVSVRTAAGPKPFGTFNLGSDRTAAKNLFKRLRGSADLDLNDMLYIEFTELLNGLPVNVDTITCDLQELGTNCMLITQEVFRLANLKEG